MRKTLICLIGCTLSLILAACGGGGSGGSGDASEEPMNTIQVPSTWVCVWENAETTTIKFNSATSVDDDGIPANWEYVPDADGKSGVMTFTYMKSNPQMKAVIYLSFIDYGRANISSTVYVDGGVYSREYGTVRKQ